MPTFILSHRYILYFLITAFFNSWNAQKMLSALLILQILYSCQPNSTTTQQVMSLPLANQDQYDHLSDTVFFDVIPSMLPFDGGLALADIKNSRIIFTDTDFNFLNYIGRAGKGPGEFLVPGVIATDGKQLYVQDLSGYKIDVFERSGDHIKSFPIPTQSSMPTFSRFAVDNQSHVYVTTPGEKHSVTKLDQAGQILQSFGESTEDNRMTSHIFHIADKEQILVAFSEIPIIERYSYEGELIDRYEFEDAPLVGNSYSYILALSEKQAQGWKYTLFQDGYYLDNYLYLVLREHPTDAKNPSLFLGSKILVLNVLDQLSLEKVFDLNPAHEKYSVISLCVTQKGDANTILTYELDGGSLQTFEF